MTAVPPALDTEDGTQDGYQRLDGTSFSAPMVSAAVAWVRAARPDLTPDQVAQVVRLSARDLGREGFDAPRASGCSTSAPRWRKPPPPTRSSPTTTCVRRRPRLRQRRARRLHAAGGGRLSALLDAYEDPADVYRVRVRAGARASRDRAEPSFGDPDLRLLPGTKR